MKTRIISLVALMLMVFNAKAGDIDDTLKVFRINFYQKVESVKLSGYCKVEIVNDSVEYLEYSNPNKSGTPKGLEYGIGGKYGRQLRIETIPGVDRLRLHLVLDASTDIHTEDYAQVDVLCPSNIVKLSVSAEDYSKVTINTERGVDTLRARRIKLAAEDYASVSMGVPCAMDDIALKAQDYAKVNVIYCRGENLKSYEQDRGKVDVESFHVTNTEFSALIEDEEVESPSVIRQLAEDRKERAQWHSDDFRFDFLWGFLNWGDKPYNGLMRMKDYCKDDDIIVLHDGIRPMIDEDVLSDVIVTCRKYGNGVTSLPYNEQIFRKQDEISTREYIPRETLRRVQTPQAYRFGQLLSCYERAFQEGIGIYGSSYTNTMMVDLGETLYFASGSERNIKITTTEDIEIFKAFLSTKRDSWLK